MNILLIFPAYVREKNGSFFPLGLASISACLKAAGHQVTCLNFNNHHQQERTPLLERTLQQQDFQMVGTGGLSVTMDTVAEILATVKRLSPHSLTVVGGGLITADADAQFHHLHPDIAVRGEGEEVMLALAALPPHRQADLSSIKGIHFWRDGQAVATPDRPAIADLNALPLEDLAGFGMDEFLAIQRNAPLTNYHRTENHADATAVIAASRSCPYRCTFCFHPASQVYRRYALERVIENIQRIRNSYDVHNFFIVDELLDFDTNRLQAFCQALADHHINIRWRCQLRVNKVTAGLLHMLKQSGCYYISFGFESGSQTILDSMKKRIKVADIERAHHLTRQEGIAVQANFLFGDPAETRTTVQETLDFQQRNKMFFVEWSAVIAYPGTPLYQRNIEKGRVPDAVAFTRRISDGATYLWKYAQPWLNMTAMADEEAQELYLQLRERGDHHHRQALAHIHSLQQTGPCRFAAVLGCPECQQTTPFILTYPPEADPLQPADSRLPFLGIRGINLLCNHCNGKMHLPSWAFPPMAAMFNRFQQIIDQLAATQKAVVVLPAMDRYWGTFTEKIKMTGLQVVAALDLRPHRWGQTFLATPVQPATVDNIAMLKEHPFLVLPTYNTPEILALLEQAAIPGAGRFVWSDGYHENATE